MLASVSAWQNDIARLVDACRIVMGIVFSESIISKRQSLKIDVISKLMIVPYSLLPVVCTGIAPILMIAYLKFCPGMKILGHTIDITARLRKLRLTVSASTLVAITSEHKRGA